MTNDLGLTVVENLGGTCVQRGLRFKLSARTYASLWKWVRPKALT